MLGMSLPGAGRGKKKHLNIEMGGRGVGAWGGGRIAYEMECLDARLLKISFPIFSPGYGPLFFFAFNFVEGEGGGG